MRTLATEDPTASFHSPAEHDEGHRVAADEQHRGVRGEGAGDVRGEARPPHGRPRSAVGFRARGYLRHSSNDGVNVQGEINYRVGRSVTKTLCHSSRHVLNGVDNLCTLQCSEIYENRAQSYNLEKARKEELLAKV